MFNFWPFVIAALVLASLFIPCYASLTVILPLLMILTDYLGLAPPLLTMGQGHIRAYDLVILVVIGKLMVLAFMHKLRLYRHYVWRPVIIFLLLLFSTTIVSYFRFSDEIFFGELSALLRFSTQVIILSLLFFSVRNLSQVNRVSKQLEYMGYALAGTVYLNIILFSFGIFFGELQVTESMIRHFGPVGDQVGFLLLLFIYKKLLDHKTLWPALYIGALLATGGRGAAIALTIGIIALLYCVRRDGLRIVRPLIISFFCSVGLGGLMYVQGIGRIIERFSGLFLQSGIEERLFATELGVQIFLENFLTGVGYTGYRYFAVEHDVWRSQDFPTNLTATATNQYVQIATDAGILGLICFVIMVISFLTVLKRAASNTEGGLRNLFLGSFVWLLSLLIGNQTAVWMLPGSLVSYVLWIILALAMVADRLTCRRKSSYRNFIREQGA